MHVFILLIAERNVNEYTSITFAIVNNINIIFNIQLIYHELLKILIVIFIKD